MYCIDFSLCIWLWHLLQLSNSRASPFGFKPHLFGYTVGVVAHAATSLKDNWVVAHAATSLKDSWVVAHAAMSLKDNWVVAHVAIDE